MQYAKLSELESFTLRSYNGYKWKKWDADNRKMLVSDTYQKEYSKKYSFETEHGTLELGAGQMKSILLEMFDHRKPRLQNLTFNVKTNGETGKDIRYFFNLA